MPIKSLRKTLASASKQLQITAMCQALSHTKMSSCVTALCSSDKEWHESCLALGPIQQHQLSGWAAEKEYQHFGQAVIEEAHGLARWPQYSGCCRRSPDKAYLTSQGKLPCSGTSDNQQNVSELPFIRKPEDNSYLLRLCSGWKGETQTSS